MGARGFRSRALAQGDAREALDERVRVVGVPLWAALVVAVLAIVGFVAWSVAGQVQNTVPVRGVISSAAGIPVIQAPVAGTVVMTPPPRGSEIRRGQVIAKINDPRGAPVPVRAVTAARIGKVLVAPGEFVSAGGELAETVPATVKPLAFVFVSPDQVPSLRVGMRTLLSPAVKQSHAAGLLKGRIVHIADFPVTRQRLTLLLGPVLAAQFETGTPVQEVEVALSRDPSTAGGFAWTNNAAAVPIRLGSSVTGRIEVGSRSPLSYLF